MNTNPPSFGQQGENNEGESPLAPASLPSPPSYGSLPSVTSYGNEDWHFPDFPAIANPSTTSASPMSPYFPGFASGSSAGVVRSYSTTPLSSTSLEIPKNSLPLPFERQLHSQSVESNTQKRTKFILEDPRMAKPKKDKAMRSCTSCFTKRLECPESEMPNRCVHCVGKTSYCKGPIETPRLYDLKRFDAMMAALLECHYNSLHIHPKSGILSPLHIDLRPKPSSEQEIVSDQQTYRLRLPHFRDDSSLEEPSNLNDVLDAILPADVPLCMAQNPGSYNLSSYECLCRRLCACLSLLRRLHDCTIDKAYKNDHRSVGVIVGFLCQVSRTASSIFAEIYEHIRKCCFTSRDRGTPKLMIILAEHLGHIHKELRAFMDTKGYFSDPLSLSETLYNGVQSLDEVENLGRGLCARAFEATYQSSDLDIGGVHLVPCFEPRGCYDTDDLCSFSQNISFMDILRNSAPHHYPTSHQPVPIMCNNDTVRSWQTNDIHDPNSTSGQHSRDSVSAAPETTIEDRIPFGVDGLQAEAYDILGPGLTLGHDDFGAAQNLEANVGTDYCHVGALESLPHGHPVPWEQQASYAHFQYYAPIDTDMSSDILPSQSHMMAPSRIESGTIQQLEPTDNNSASSMIGQQLCSVPVPTPAKVPKKTSKRKAIMKAFSRKKARLTPSHLNYSEDSRAPIADLRSQLGKGTEPAVKTATNNNTILSKRPSDEYQKEQLRSELMWEQVNNKRTELDDAGIVREFEVTNSERRPMSWPHRNPWRKSLDISVAVLTKGFERLMTERGESSLSVT